ncbi:hypothetical protein SynTAK9802_02389 [Synechococcus sp. TAK9802]|nr:hypothetical protein SynTAK9802_02389 [Synechococcus sp. TAK9802]
MFQLLEQTMIEELALLQCMPLASASLVTCLISRPTRLRLT